MLSQFQNDFRSLIMTDKQRIELANIKILFGMSYCNDRYHLGKNLIIKMIIYSKGQS